VYVSKYTQVSKHNM